MVEQTGGQLVAASLAALGADTIFSVSGNQIMPIYDAAADYGIRIVHMRHETAAAYAAAADAELRGKPAVVLTSAGPGFLATLQGVAAAASMELPLVFLSGDSPVSHDSRGAFQDIDQQRVAGAICKESWRVTDAGDIQPAIYAAWRAAQQPIPGPVHLSLPADVLLGLAGNSTEQPPQLDILEPKFAKGLKVRLGEMADLLAGSTRPLLVARPSAARGRAGAALSRLATVLDIEPVIIEAPRGLSDLKYLDHVSEFLRADCVLVVAPPDFAVSFLDEAVLASDGHLLMINVDGDPFPGREVAHYVQYPTELALEHVADHLERTAETDPDWSGLWPITSPPPAPAGEDDGLHPLAITETVRRFLQPNDILVIDGGELCQWVRYGLRDVPNRMLWNGKIGAIGGGIPMGTGAAVSSPGSRVFCFLGDGTAGYHLSEFETAARYDLPLIAIIGNDARWAAEWHLQVSRYGRDRTFETTLLEARYDEAAIGFSGGSGEFVTGVEQLAGALEEYPHGGLQLCLNVRIQALQSPAKMA